MKKDVWNDTKAKKGLLRGRHSFCFSYPAKGQEQPQRNSIVDTLEPHGWESQLANQARRYKALATIHH
jgi:hypothetical protein